MLTLSFGVSPCFCVDVCGVWCTCFTPPPCVAQQAQAVAVPPKAAGKEADDDDSVAENKGCWACLCRCWHSKSATAPSQITVSPIVGCACVLNRRLLSCAHHLPPWTLCLCLRLRLCLCLQRSPSLRGLLPPASKENQGKKCLVLDLDETLVHSSFKPIPRPDYVIPVEIDRNVHHVYVRKRPGCDLFLRALAPHYEIVVFTASLAKVRASVCVSLYLLPCLSVCLSLSPSLPLSA